MKRIGRPWLDDALLLPPKRRRRGAQLTVCIAARCDNSIVLASDTMLTAGDIQFEPERTKIVMLTNSIAILTAGDASFLTLVITRLNGWVQHRISEEPNEWMTVQEVVSQYVRFFNEWKARFAEDAILAPLGLTMETFLERQTTMLPEIVRKLTTEILNFTVPDCAIIVAGRDPGGTFLRKVEGISVTALETVGFAAVGIGERHAQSHFMEARYGWSSTLSDGLFHAYTAKRRSEVAPGVGQHTDMVIIGPELGSSVEVNDFVKGRLEDEYQRLVATETNAANEAKDAIAGFLAETQRAAAVAAPQQGEIAEDNVTTTIPDGAT